MIQDNIVPIVIVLGALLAVAVALVVYLFWRLRRLEGDCELLIRSSEGRSFVEIVADHIAHVDELTGEVEALSEQYAMVLRRMAGSVQHVGVVRFDAFRDMGGMLSFAVALLDDRGNGLVLSSIYGRNETRTYAKPVIERSSSYELSPEEKEAIRLSLQSRELGALPVEARDVEHEQRIASLRQFHEREYTRPVKPERQPPRQDRAASTAGRERRGAPARRPEPQRSRPEQASEKKEQPKTGAQEGERAVPRAGRAERRKRKEEEREAAGGALQDRTSPESPLFVPDEEPVISRSERSTPRRLDDMPTEALEGERGALERDRGARQGRSPDRPRGLNTPVERLRDREPGGE